MVASYFIAGTKEEVASVPFQSKLLFCKVLHCVCACAYSEGTCYRAWKPPHLHHVECILPPHGVRILHILPPLLLNILWPVSKNPYATLSFQSTLIFSGYKSSISSCREFGEFRKIQERQRKWGMREKEREYEEWITGDSASQRQQIYYSAVFLLRRSLLNILLLSSVNSTLVCTSSVIFIELIV